MIILALPKKNGMAPDRQSPIIQRKCIFSRCDIFVVFLLFQFPSRLYMNAQYRFLSAIWPFEFKQKYTTCSYIVEFLRVLLVLAQRTVPLVKNCLSELFFPEVELWIRTRNFKHSAKLAISLHCTVQSYFASLQYRVDFCEFWTFKLWMYKFAITAEVFFYKGISNSSVLTLPLSKSVWFQKLWLKESLHNFLWNYTDTTEPQLRKQRQ